MYFFSCSMSKKQKNTNKRMSFFSLSEDNPLLFTCKKIYIYSYAHKASSNVMGDLIHHRGRRKEKYTTKYVLLHMKVIQ